MLLAMEAANMSATTTKEATTALVEKVSYFEVMEKAVEVRVWVDVSV